MNHFPKFKFFINALIGMSISLGIATALNGAWEDDAVLIPFLLLADVIFSFYFVYKVGTCFHFPSWANLMFPIAYGVLIPVVLTGLLYIIMTVPIKPAVQNGMNFRLTGNTMYDEAIVVICVVSFIAAILALLLTWLGIGIWNRFKSKSDPVTNNQQGGGR